jgi:putative DNA primase/helicase
MNLESITLCPERTEYKKFINDPESGGLPAKEYGQTKKALIERYKLAFHNYLAEVYPNLRFEVGEEKVYWNYNETTGIYEEVAHTTVKEWVMKLLIDEDIIASATDAFAKTVLGRYRACYAERGSTYDDFDKDDGYFHAANGWVQLDTLEFTPHTPDRISRRKSAVAYDAKAVSPTYDKFLDEDTLLKKDQVRVIDQFSGLCLTNDIKQQKMLTLIGRPGCGKSTLLEIWVHILGEMAVEKKLTELQGEAMRFAGSQFVGSTLCWFDEVDVKKAEMGNTLGTLITGHRINIERKGVNGIVKAYNTMKCVLTANKLPNTAEVGIYRRLILIHMTRSFTDSEVAVLDMPEKLRNEASGILNRMIRGLQDLRKMKTFTMIAGHADLIEEYKAQSDTIAEFLDTYFKVGDTEDFVETRYLYDSYRHFTEGNSWSRGITPQRFGRLLATQPLTRFAKIQPVQMFQKGRGWTGLKLKEDYKFNEHTGVIEEVHQSNF